MFYLCGFTETYWIIWIKWTTRSDNSFDCMESTLFWQHVYFVSSGCWELTNIYSNITKMKFKIKQEIVLGWISPNRCISIDLWPISIDLKPIFKSNLALLRCTLSSLKLCVKRDQTTRWYKQFLPKFYKIAPLKNICQWQNIHKGATFSRICSK